MKTETSLTIVIIIALMLKFFHLPGSDLLLVLTFTILALVYFPFSFFFFSDKKIKRQNLGLSIISGFFFSVLALGFLFKILYWPGAQFMLLVGGITTAIAFVVTLTLKQSAADDLKTYYRNMMTRTVILTALAALLYLTPMETLLKIQYREDPEMARLKTQLYTNPENEEYRKQHDAYIERKKAGDVIHTDDGES